MSVSKFITDFDPFAAHLRDHFGLGLHPDDVTRTGSCGLVPHERSILPTGYNRPWALVPHRRPLDATKTASNVTTAKDGTFQVCVDVHHFAPKEIHVKTVNNLIVIEGKHEERTDDHGFIERRFVRKYTLPEQYSTEHIVSSLSSDGVLTVKAPPPAVAGHRFLPVHHTGPAHLSIKEHGNDTAAQANEEKKK